MGNEPEKQTRYRAVLFDGYGTLFSGAMEKLKEVCEAVVEGECLDMDGAGFLESWERIFFPLVRGEPFATLAEAQTLSLKALFGELGVTTMPEFYTRPMLELLCSAEVYEDVRPTLSRLGRLATGIVSNADIVHIDSALSRNGLSFPVVVTSESAACYKPNPAIFETGLREIGCTAAEALYVGDSQGDDIVGATGVGMDVAWLNRTGEKRKKGIPDPTYEIQSLAEVPMLVNPLL